MENDDLKTQILTDEQFNSPENQNRDKAIIGYRSIENGTKPLIIARVSKSVCDHDYVYKILHDHTAADICTKCRNIKKQTVC